jgi:ribose 5-phosphate isomerase B
MSKPTIYMASDHRGVSLKSRLADMLAEDGYNVRDLGTHDEESCNASDYATRLAEALKDDPKARGVLICGTGQAMAMTANRYRHIRAALCTDGTMARLARQHNDANVLALGAAIIGTEVAKECLAVFLTMKSLGGRYAERVKMLDDLGGL